MKSVKDMYQVGVNAKKTEDAWRSNQHFLNCGIILNRLNVLKEDYMSRKYTDTASVPAETLANRLDELAGAITKGREASDREFTMRIPAECDRDADLVLSEAAKRLRSLNHPNVVKKGLNSD